MCVLKIDLTELLANDLNNLYIFSGIQSFKFEIYGKLRF